jgi:hypothetical protein
MTDDERRELRDLMQAHDRMMTEHQEWMARREAAASPPARENGPQGILYRATENNAQPPVAAMDATPSDDDVAQLFDDPELNRNFTHAMGYVISELRHEWRTERDAALVERDRKIGILEGELREMKGMLGAVLALMGGKPLPTSNKNISDDSTVIELPRFLRRTHDNAA